jgi:hypothetical protein
MVFVSDASVMVDRKLIKTAGEHWVCATLARHSWAPALTRDGIERTDILAVSTRLAHRPTVEIQVKTATGRGSLTSWPLGAITRLVAASQHEWFVLLLLPRFPLEPRAFVVPRDHASPATWVVQQNWLTDPSVPEGKRNAGMSQARIRLIIWQGYENCWDLLGTPTSEVRVRLGFQAGYGSERRMNELACLQVIPGTKCCLKGDTFLHESIMVNSQAY